MKNRTSREHGERGADAATDKPILVHEQNPFHSLLRNRTFLLALAFLVAVILAVTLPSRFTEIVKEELSERNLDKIDTCKRVADVAARNDCYRDLALSTNQSSFCGRVFNSTSVSTSCVAELSIKTSDKQLCQTLKDIKTRSYCLAELAVQDIELPLCDNIDDRDWRNYCYGKLALLTGKPDACARVEGVARSAECYLDLARNLSSGPTCAFIPDQAKREGCYLVLGPAVNDPALCKEIETPPTRWSCYHRIARNTQNERFCENIPESLRQNCIEAAKEGPLP